MNDESYTPWNIVQPLADEFAGGKFDLDPCTIPQVAKAKAYYTIEDDGLTQPWFGTVWMNPPYSKPGLWIDKAIHETRTGNCDLVVALLLGSGGTTWHHQAVKNASLVRMYPRRIQFETINGSKIHSRWGSIIFVFGKLPGRHGTVAHTCASCNSVFWPARSDARTCSDACRMALSRSKGNTLKQGEARKLHRQVARFRITTPG